MVNRTVGSSRITLLMMFAVLGGFAIIIMMNIASMLGVVPERYISPNDVRGMAVEHNNTLFTLNFEQQNALVDIFNRSIPVGEEIVETRKVKGQSPEIQKIIIYRFNAPDIEITPVAYIAKSSSAFGRESHANIAFSAPQWNPQGLLEETSADNLHQLLSSTYDH